jgi:hypothetical protein
MKVFISGSIAINKLSKLAIQRIDNIIKHKFTVLVGDAKGVDLQVQKYLLENKYNNVIIYFAGNNTRNNVGNWEAKKIIDEHNNKKGRELYTLKDIAMAKDADYGLMIWDGKSKGTLSNIQTMKSENKKFLVILGDFIVTDTNIDSIIKEKVSESIIQQPE